MTVLEISGVRKQFGGVVALAGVDVTIKSDEILGIIGPNGSGKTTLFNAVCGVYRPDAGRVRWDGADITARPAFEIGRLGIGRTFQQAMSFPSLSVRENVQIAMENGSARRDGTTGRWSSPEELLGFVGLEGYADETANAMPFGNLRRLGIAVALGGARRNCCSMNQPRGSMKRKASNWFNSFAASTSSASASASSTIT